MSDPREYHYFYLIGRRDEELACDVDLTALAERVLAGEALRDACNRVAKDASVAAQHAGHQRDWLLSNKQEIAEAGGNETHAYDLYLAGQMDELAHRLEPEVMEEMQEILDDIDLGSGTPDDDDEADDGEHDDERERVI